VISGNKTTRNLFPILAAFALGIQAFLHQGSDRPKASGHPSKLRTLAMTLRAAVQKKDGFQDKYLKMRIPGKLFLDGDDSPSH